MNYRTRRIAALLLAVLALAVFFLPWPADDGSTRVEAILSEATLNGAVADSAPQQQVVAGWAARDLLAVIADDQSREAAAQERTSALLLLGIVGLGLVLLSGRTPRQLGNNEAPPDMDDPPAPPAPTSARHTASELTPERESNAPF